MKTLVSIIVILFAVGCGKTETKTETETVKTEPKPLSPEQKFVGTYEVKFEGITDKLVLLENGKVETYKNGEKEGEGTWKFEAKEVHVLEDGEEITYILKIEPNGDLDMIARIKVSKREEAPKERQYIFKKLK